MNLQWIEQRQCAVVEVESEAHTQKLRAKSGLAAHTAWPANSLPLAQQQQQQPLLLSPLVNRAQLSSAQLSSAPVQLCC